MEHTNLQVVNVVDLRLLTLHLFFLRKTYEFTILFNINTIVVFVRLRDNSDSAQYNTFVFFVQSYTR